MKYIITESKLNEVITNYLNDMFDTSEMNWSNPYDYNDETGEEGEDENRVEFYLEDYDDDEICFRWYDCGYFTEYSVGQEFCPTVLVEYPYIQTLNGLFNELWHEPFKQWFTDNFNLPIKTVDHM